MWKFRKYAAGILAVAMGFSMIAPGGGVQAASVNGESSYSAESSDNGESLYSVESSDNGESSYSVESSVNGESSYNAESSDNGESSYDVGAFENGEDNGEDASSVTSSGTADEIKSVFINSVSLNEINEGATGGYEGVSDDEKQIVCENPITKAEKEKNLAAGSAGMGEYDTSKKLVVAESADKAGELDSADKSAEAGATEVVEPTYDAKAPVLLDSQYVEIKNYYSDTMVYNAKNNGYYFLRGRDGSYNDYKDVIFYDIANNTYKNVYSTPSYVREVFHSDKYMGFLSESMSRMESSVVEGDKTYSYEYSLSVIILDLDSQQTKTVTLDKVPSTLNWAGYISAFGIDDSGRIYVASKDNEITLFSATGKKLSKTDTKEEVYEFCGFDSVNGNFYYKSKYNWVYWGYNHDMSSLMAGNVKNNVISVTDENLSILYQSGFYNHVGCVEMLSGKYLGVLSTFNSNMFMLLDSNSYDYKDYTTQTTSISMVDSSVTTSPMNISSTDNIKFAIYTAASDYSDNGYDVSSEGCRARLTTDGSGIIVKSDANTLVEYRISDKTKQIEATTTYPVYDFAVVNKKICIIEKYEGNFYYEEINWEYPSDYTVNAPASIISGGSGKIVCETEGVMTLQYSFSSSDSSVVSVDSTGNLTAWKTGTATITIDSSPVSVKKTVNITVVANSAFGSGTYKETNATGASSSNIHLPKNKGYYGNVTTSYMNMMKDGRFERIEAVDGIVIVERFSKTNAFVKHTDINYELSEFGGFYNDGTYNYLVFGELNVNEDDNCEVIRVVKYDSEWKRIGACSIKGANTYNPFEAGGLDMVVAGGKLYVYTCHKMYGGGGTRHQANCTFVITVSDMKLVDQYSDVMNISYGYVSHSFMQYITADENYIYRSDLGDANPRGIAFTSTKIANQVTNVDRYGSVLSIPGNYGSNYTGYALGGMTNTADYVQMAGYGIANDSDTFKNVWVSVVDKNSGSVISHWVTKYNANS